MVPFAAIDANGWAVIIAAFFLGVTKVTSMVIDYLHFKENRKNLIEVKETVAHTTSETATKLDDTATKLDDMAKVGDATHTLVNNNMGIQLRLNVVALGRIKELTHDDPEDVAAWNEAVRLLRDHEAKQRLVDEVKERDG